MQSKPSAMLVLGVYVGVVAALAIVPVSIPLLNRLVVAETAADRAALYAKTARAGLSIEAGGSPNFSDALSVRVVSFEGRLLLENGVPIKDPSLEDRVCGAPSGVVALSDARPPQTATCFESKTLRAFAIYPTSTRSYLDIGLFAFALALLSGLVAALGVLRILRPLSRIGRTLERVGMREHGVRMRRTGILEVDQLIDRMNSLASAVEERENSILARVQVAQEIARLVAHEVRNPLQSMELLTSLLADEEDPVERRALSSSIHDEIRALDDVVTRLLKEGASRGTLRLHVQEEDVDALLVHVAKMKRTKAERQGTRLEMDLGDVGVLPIDRPLLSRSIENLVSNALRAVPTPNGTIRLASRINDDFISIIVEDNGPGIDPELGAAIFDANVSGEGGSGLGLSLTRGVVEAHGGSVRFEQGDLGGARFILSLPRTPPIPE